MRRQATVLYGNNVQPHSKLVYHKSFIIFFTYKKIILHLFLLIFFTIKTKLMNYYLKVLKDYATFSGRARRSEYWYFALFNVIFAIVASLLDRLIGDTFTTNFGSVPMNLGYGYIYVLYALAVFIPGLAVLVRRLHDVGKSGWFFFIILIPLVGFIWLLVLLFTDSQYGPNKYGLNPKGIGNTDEIDEIGNYINPQPTQ